MKQKKDRSLQKEDILEYSLIARYMILSFMLTAIVITIGGLVIAFQRTEQEVITSHRSIEEQVTNRVGEALRLLKSLAIQPEYYDPDIPPLEKVAKLDRIPSEYGYMMVCYVDADSNVYTIGEEPASLASREYMQRLFSTGEPQVTDSFAAGADGMTLNYTVAVPLKQGDEITGALFCAIYFDDVVDILKKASQDSNAQAVLIGSQGQIMSSANNLQYGDAYMDYVRRVWNIGMTADELETAYLARIPGSYWSIGNGGLFCTMHSNVSQTGWVLLTSINFGEVLACILPGFFLIVFLMALVCTLVFLIVRRYIKAQKKIVDMLVQSVQELEEKIYQDERPDNVDFREIIRLTSNGLSDGLTGVVTRSVFLKQAETLLNKAPEGKLTCLCFVDLDNLKRLNDTYGHGMGDNALKNVGYILREYEKKYDGVVGRYGGDEFVLLLVDIDDEEELKSVMESMSLQLHSDIGSEGRSLQIHCSIGVAINRPGNSIEDLIAKADEALYFVKQNGKGYYKISLD